MDAMITPVTTYFDMSIKYLPKFSLQAPVSFLSFLVFIAAKIRTYFETAKHFGGFVKGKKKEFGE